MSQYTNQQIQEILVQGLKALGKTVEVLELEPGRQAGTPDAYNYEDIVVQWGLGIDQIVQEKNPADLALRMTRSLLRSMAKWEIEARSCRFIYLDNLDHTELPEVYIAARVEGFPITIRLVSRDTDSVTLQVGTAVNPKVADRIQS